MTPLRVVLVDDEPLARRRLREMLADHADVRVVGEAEEAAGALAMVRAERPDLLLLDIRMPGEHGLALVRRLHLTPAPYVIFVTAHAEHAVEAFDAEAVDYLLKPYDEERLARALERARGALARRRPPAYLQRFAVLLGRKTGYLPVARVDWIEGGGNYARLHAGKEVHLVRTTLTALERELDPARFARVHRSAIVALDQVRELESLGGGEYRLLLKDGTRLPVSQRYRARLP
ncbi:MAG: response regulator transcription factor [Gemmatimonadales bacterium]|nr:response regulator transcription factor [Gemmatimonadales bacterium]